MTGWKVRNNMKALEWKRMSLQTLVCSGLLGIYLLRFPDALTLYFQLLFVCISSIFVSTIVESKVKLSGSINSVTINLVVFFLFYLLGNSLEGDLRLEIIEGIKPDLSEEAGGGGTSRVLTSMVIGFGGMEFLFIYGFNAIFAYAKYLPEFRKNEVSTGVEAGQNNQEIASQLNKFSVKQGGKLQFISYDEIQYVEASGNYINVFSSGKKYTLRAPLQDWLSNAKKSHLLRVHRSFVINTNAIKELSSNSDGQYSVILNSGDSVKVGKQYKASLFEYLGLK